MWPGTSQPGPGSQGSAPRPALPTPPECPRQRLLWAAQVAGRAAHTQLRTHLPFSGSETRGRKREKATLEPSRSTGSYFARRPIGAALQKHGSEPDRGFLAAFIHHQTPPGSSFRHSTRRTPGARAAGACNPCSARGQDRGPGSPPPRSSRCAASKKPSGFTGLRTPPPQILWRSAVPGSLPSAPLWPHSGHALVTLWSCPRSLRRRVVRLINQKCFLGEAPDLHKTAQSCPPRSRGVPTWREETGVAVTSPRAVSPKVWRLQGPGEQGRWRALGRLPGRVVLPSQVRETSSRSRRGNGAALRGQAGGWRPHIRRPHIRRSQGRVSSWGGAS